MRIQGIHLQGIRAPQGECRLTLDPGYNVIVARDGGEARALLHLVETLLYPDRDPATMAASIAGGSVSARVGLAFSIRGHAYRLILDLSGRRLLLARFDPAEKRYARLSTDIRGVRAALSEAGLPPRQELDQLHLYDPAAPSAPPPLPARVAASADLGADPADGSGETAAAEREIPAVVPPSAPPPPADAGSGTGESEGEGGSSADAWASVQTVPDLAERLERFREQTALRDGERVAVEAARRSLIAERARLRAVPSSQIATMWVGVALGAAGALAGALVQPAFLALAAAGLFTAGYGLVRSEHARRRVGQVEARLAALRVREASIERRFEAETASVRALQQALGVDTVEELERELADWKAADLNPPAAPPPGSAERADVAEREDVAERADVAEREEVAERAEAAEREEVAERAEVAELEGVARSRSMRSAPAEEHDEPPTPRVAVPRAGWAAAAAQSDGRVGELVRAAVSAGDVREPELRERLAPTLAIYLRALTGGAYTRARFQVGTGWCYRQADKDEDRVLADVPVDVREQIVLAFQLALLEALGGSLRLPLLLGPDLLRGRSELERATLGRALKRLGQAVQVIQCSAEAEPWSEHASATHHLPSSST